MQGKVVALWLLHHFGIYCDDECRLQRLVPYVMTLLEDSNAYVKVSWAALSLRLIVVI